MTLESVAVEHTAVEPVAAHLRTNFPALAARMIAVVVGTAAADTEAHTLAAAAAACVIAEQCRTQSVARTLVHTKAAVDTLQAHEQHLNPLPSLSPHHRCLQVPVLPLSKVAKASPFLKPALEGPLQSAHVPLTLSSSNLPRQPSYFEPVTMLMGFHSENFLLSQKVGLRFLVASLLPYFGGLLLLRVPRRAPRIYPSYPCLHQAYY